MVEIKLPPKINERALKDTFRKYGMLENVTIKPKRFEGDKLLAIIDFKRDNVNVDELLNQKFTIGGSRSFVVDKSIKSKNRNTNHNRYRNKRKNHLRSTSHDKRTQD